MQTADRADCADREDWEVFKNIYHFKCIIFIYFFPKFFLACDMLEKKMEKLKLVYKGDGLVKNVLLQVSVFLGVKSVPVSAFR